MAKAKCDFLSATTTNMTNDNQNNMDMNLQQDVDITDAIIDPDLFLRSFGISDDYSSNTSTTTASDTGVMIPSPMVNSLATTPSSGGPSNMASAPVQVRKMINIPSPQMSLLSIEIKSPGCPYFPRGPNNMVFSAAKAALDMQMSVSL